MAFDEDGSRVRTSNVPQTFWVLRHIALNLLWHGLSKGSINTKHLHVALDEQHVRKVF